MKKFIAIGMLIFAIGFNLWLYKMEPTATIDPNDNAFQFALVDRTNQIWDFADKNCPINLSLVTCHLSLLIDHWVPNWAEGYNLPFYYSHVPQIIIVGSWRLLHSFIGLFTYYHWVIYLLLCFFPLSVFLALRIIDLPWLAAGIGALLATHLSTDGLYGLDPSSFLWRGYGLSSQLFAMIWLPLALAYTWKYFSTNTKSGLWPAVIFMTATVMGHLGIGIIALLSLIPLALAHPSKQTLIKFIVLGGTVIFLLSYWIIPIVMGDNFHNISFWDPVWKFNSYGAKETIVRLFNGDLFDFGRFPIFTLLIFVGAFACIQKRWKSFTFLFLFWFFLYFGRTTWGGLIDLIPGMKDFHLSRFLVGVHIAGIFLAPIGFEWLVSLIPDRRIRILGILGILGLLLPPIYQQTIRYSQFNDTLIARANENHKKVSGDEQKLFAKLRSLPPARIFAGRGGGFGKDFRVAETPYYMQLSTFGLPTTLWLPETWSMNSDTEQYFSEDQAKDYDLYNMRWVAAPPDQKPQPFWKKIDEAATWKLYEVPTSGYFTTGVRPAIVAVDKRSFVNVVRLWIQPDAPKNGLFPELTFDKDYPKTTGLPNFKMIDEVTYKTPDQKTHNLWNEPPQYQQSTFSAILQTEVVDSDMIFKTHVEVGENCVECLVILKQTYHPNWKATVDGKAVTPIIVFPFYIGIPVTQGTHEVIVSYEPSGLKMGLLFVEIVSIIAFILYTIKSKF